MNYLPLPIQDIILFELKLQDIAKLCIVSKPTLLIVKRSSWWQELLVIRNHTTNPIFTLKECIRVHESNRILVVEVWFFW